MSAANRRSVSTQGSRNRRRGHDAERAVVNYLRQNGFPDARRYLAGDSRQPGDIDVWPGICIEVKDRAQSAWPTWREQALEEAGPDRIAVVVRRFRGVTDAGRWPADVPKRDWLWIGGTLPADTVQCPRTRELWVRTTFGRVCELVREAS